MRLLVAGDHTRAVTIATPTTGGLMGFVKKTLTCLSCRAPLNNIAKGGSASSPSFDIDIELTFRTRLSDSAVCKNCKAKGKTAELYQKHVRTVSNASRPSMLISLASLRFQQRLKLCMLDSGQTANDAKALYIKT